MQKTTNTYMTVDFSEMEYYPLVKEKLGIFQEIEVIEPENFMASVDSIRQLRLGMFRGLTNFGRKKWDDPEQIYQEDGEIKVRKSKSWSALINILHQSEILPMLTLFRNPTAFPGKNEENKWSSLAKDINGYAKAIQRLLKLYRDQKPLSWEIWNEPNLKAFLDTDTPDEDYFEIFRCFAPAIKAADSDYLVAGPSLATGGDVSHEKRIANEEFMKRYRDEAAKGNQLPLDYYTIHSYERFRSEDVNVQHVGEDRLESAIKSARNSLSDDFQTVPIVFTEYEFYTAGGKGLTGRHEEQRKLREVTTGACQALNDLKHFLMQTDISSVTWNRYKKNGPDGKFRAGGLLDSEGRKHPTYYAFLMYGWMPVDRNKLTLSDDEVDAFASSDEDHAGVMIWNSSTEEKSITINMKGIPKGVIASEGRIGIYRIDKNHASFRESLESPYLDEVEYYITKSSDFVCDLTIPGPGIVYLKLGDRYTDACVRRRGMYNAKYMRSWRWCSRELCDDGTSRITGDYGEFDRFTWIARLGTNSSKGKGLSGVTIDNTPDNLYFNYKAYHVKASNDDINTLMAIRVDYEVDGIYTKSIMMHGKLFNPNREDELPWGKGGATADVLIDVSEEMDNAEIFGLSVLDNAPAGWEKSLKKRCIISFWMQGTGEKAMSVIQMSDI